MFSMQVNRFEIPYDDDDDERLDLLSGTGDYQPGARNAIIPTKLEIGTEKR